MVHVYFFCVLSFRMSSSNSIERRFFHLHCYLRAGNATTPGACTDKWPSGIVWKYEAELGKYDQKPLANEVCWNESCDFDDDSMESSCPGSGQPELRK